MDGKEKCPLAPQVCILIVDDDPSVLQLVEDVLSLNYEVEGLADPRQALELLDHEHFDIVLVELGMPQLDGFELIRRIRSQPGGQALPIIAMSAFDQLRERVENVPVDAVVSKPFSIEKLEDTIEQVISRRCAVGNPNQEKRPV